MSEPEARASGPAAAADAAASDADATAAPGDGCAADAGPAPAVEPDYRDRWLRAEAELQNFRRRAARDLDEACRAVEDRLLLGVIDILDDVERGIDSARAGEVPEPWMQGMELVAVRMREFLARAGVTPMAVDGRPFDPHLHEAMVEVDASGGAVAGGIVHVFRRGYLRGDRPLRVARVSVARAADG